MSRVSNFSDQIRSAIRGSGISRYALSKRTGVTQAALCRFMQGQCGLTTDTLDRLAPKLKLRVDALYAQTPVGAAGKRVSYANMLANARKQRAGK
jgi:transcriptional regulator with XRE-family HTH domain